MRYIHFGLDLFREENPPADARAVRILEKCLALLVDVNESYLDLHPECPLMYLSGIRYEQERPREELFKSIPVILQDPRHIDCEDLACWRVAELRRRFNEPGAKVFYYWREAPGMKLFHIQVLRANGHVEDPSVLLGMGKSPQSLRSMPGRVLE